MKFSSKVLGILLVLLAVAIVVSAASASGLVKNDFNNGNFTMDVPSDSNFQQDVISNFSVGEIAVNIVFYENKANNSNDVNTIIYFKDSSVNRTMISDFIEDIEMTGENVEETDKYVVLKTAKNSKDFDITNDFESIFSFVENLFSSDDTVSVSASSSGNNESFDLDSNIESFDYAVYLKHSDDKVVVISGDNLELLKSMAETVSFN